MAFKHISLLWSAKGVIMGQVGDTAFLPVQKAHITTFESMINISTHISSRAFGPLADVSVSG